MIAACWLQGSLPLWSCSRAIRLPTLPIRGRFTRSGIVARKRRDRSRPSRLELLATTSFCPRSIAFAAVHESAFGPKRTSLVAPHMSAFGGKADIALSRRTCLLLTQSGHGASLNGPHLNRYD